MTSDINKFYEAKNVLLTGGTGFLGKLIIQKLLRVSNVNEIHLIVRAKKGLIPEKRLQNLLDEPIFSKLLVEYPDCTRKIKLIEGDLCRKKIGMREEDRELIKNKINIVFHCGASLNMDSKLGDAVITNVRGTSEILDLIKDIRNLEAFVLVSTTYSNCPERCIEEKFYEKPMEPELLIRMSEELRADTLNAITQGLIGKWPNSYVFTKAVAENLLLTKGQGLPVGLFRPCIVTSTAFEPMPGWSGNLYGPLGTMLSSHCGILRVVQAHGDLRSHTVPGDMCVNALLCFARDVNIKWKSHAVNLPPVMNVSTKDTKLHIPVKQFVDVKNLNYRPFKRAMWYQVLYLTESRRSYMILRFFLHTIPAYIIDALLLMSFKKPRMRKLYSKLEKTSAVLEPFLVKEWDVENENFIQLWNNLNDEDKTCYNFNLNSLDVDGYLVNVLDGLKQYVLKEDMSKSHIHKKRYQKLVVLHFALKYTFIGYATYRFYKVITLFLRRKKFIF